MRDGPCLLSADRSPTLVSSSKARSRRLPRTVHEDHPPARDAAPRAGRGRPRAERLGEARRADDDGARVRRRPTLRGETLAFAGLAPPRKEKEPAAEAGDASMPPVRRRGERAAADGEKAADDAAREAFHERMAFARDVEGLVTAIHRDFLALRLSPAWNTEVVSVLEAWVAGEEVVTVACETASSESRAPRRCPRSEAQRCATVAPAGTRDPPGPEAPHPADVLSERVASRLRRSRRANVRRASSARARTGRTSRPRRTRRAPRGGALGDAPPRTRRTPRSRPPRISR